MKKLSKQWIEKHEWWVLGAILAGFSAIVLGNITRWSIWFDEAFSAYLVRFDLVRLTHFTAQDVHPPMYYWVLKLWTNVFGHSLFAVRSLSWALAIVGLVGLYFVVRYLTKSKSYGLIATAAAALTPTLVRFSEEARMYTLVFAIVMWATYALLRAVETNRHRYWAVYRTLLAVGMLTHYFAAMAWLAHWVWRYVEVRSGRIKTFFSREWLMSYVLAIGLFAWWIPTVLWQFASVQMGFWIPPITPNSPVNYLTDLFFYRESTWMEDWWAVAAFATFALVAIILWRGWPILVKRSRKGAHTLFASLVLAPPLFLAVLSLPPLRSTFIDRYVLYAQIMLPVVVALCLAVLAKSRPQFVRRAAPLLVLVALVGIGNVYYYGNYNKNSNTSVRTGDVMKKISEDGTPGQPVIAATPWVYYEASFYSNEAHPVYYPESTLNENIGSLAMLKEDDTGKIDDLEAFAQRYKYVWYIDSTDKEIVPPIASWKLQKTVEGYDSIDGVTKYRAALFAVQKPSAE